MLGIKIYFQKLEMSSDYASLLQIESFLSPAKLFHYISGDFKRNFRLSHSV